MYSTKGCIKAVIASGRISIKVLPYDWLLFKTTTEAVAEGNNAPRSAKKTVKTSSYNWFTEQYLRGTEEADNRQTVCWTNGGDAESWISHSGTVQFYDTGVLINHMSINKIQ